MNDLFGLGSTVSTSGGYGKALFMQEYSINIAKKSMMTEVLDAKRMLKMAPTPPKGQYIDVYA